MDVASKVSCIQWHFVYVTSKIYIVKIKQILHYVMLTRVNYYYLLLMLVRISCFFVYSDVLFILCFAGPSSLNVTTTKNIKSSSIVLQWDAVDDSLTTSYTIIWSTRAGGGLQVATLTEQTSYTINGLSLDTVYTIAVTAANECGSGPEFRTSISLSAGMYD